MSTNLTFEMKSTRFPFIFSDIQLLPLQDQLWLPPLFAITCGKHWTDLNGINDGNKLTVYWRILPHTMCASREIWPSLKNPKRLDHDSTKGLANCFHSLHKAVDSDLKIVSPQHRKQKRFSTVCAVLDFCGDTGTVRSNEIL